MVDSETVVAETSTITEYPSSASHMAVDYNTAGSDGTGEGGDMATGPTSEPTSTNSTDGTYPVPDGSSSVDQSAYGTDPSSVMQEDPISSTHNGETVVGVGGDTGNLVRQENAVQAGHYVASQENVVQAGHYVAIQETTVQDGHYVASQENAAQTGDYVAGQENAVQAGHYVASQENAVQGGHYVAGQENAVQAAHYVASQENAVQAGTYDTSMNGNGATEVNIVNSVGHDANGNVLSNAVEAVSEQQYDAGPAISTEEERLWNIVKTNPLDFDAWTALIGETERVAQDNILKIRKIYDTFLAEFPLCYGYWKKYADHEARFGFVDKVVEVYERAVLAVTYSVDIWLHYCTFAKSAYEDPDIVRRLFERGLAYVGTDYLSYPLWDKYIEYEYERLEWSHLATIYTRILESPGQQLDRYFNSFKELAGSRSLSELRTAEEAAAMAAVNSEVAVQQVEGEVRQDGAEHSLKSLGAGLTEAEELEKYVSIREEMYRKAKEFDSKIIGFETAIRRPYFHVHPLKGSELENWHSYLDFIESGDDFNKYCALNGYGLTVKPYLLHYMLNWLKRWMKQLLKGGPAVVKLYERCLIACANYSEFWTRYVLCMEASGSIELANNALARATQVFVKRQPDIHLFSARFKEQIGDISAARAEYQLVHSGISPGLLEAIVNHANMEYRLGHKEDAFSVYEHAIATEKGKEHSQTLPVLYVQYSRFQSLVAGNVEKAREILDGAADHVQLTKPFLEGLLFLESVQSAPKRMDYIASVVEKFILPNSENANAPSTTDREDISSIYLEFLGLFGDSQSIKKAADRHAKLFLNHRSKSESKKRSAEDYLASDKTKVANSYASIPSPAQPVMGAYPTSQNPWPASYGVQPQSQAYVQAPQAQGQQWNPAYAQQAAYGAYSGYNTSYTQPQAPVSAPQTTAYGAYPQSYPTQQTYPQQNYTQPATATAAVAYAQPAAAGAVAYTPAQPQAAAPVSQAYYGTYY